MSSPAGQRLHAATIALRNVLAGANIDALWLRSPRDIVHYASEALFLRRALHGRRGLPERQIWEVLGTGADCHVRLANVATSCWPPGQATYLADLVNLCRATAALRPRRVFEIGTYHGYSTLHLALNAAPDALVFTLDLPPGAGLVPRLATTLMDDIHIASATATDYFFTGTPAADRIRPLFGDSASFDFGPYHGTIDLFFIDGAHSYDYVRADTSNALACTRAGGLIAWHDFGRVGVNGVSRWLHELRGRGWPVVAAPGGSLAYMVVPEHAPPAT